MTAKDASYLDKIKGTRFAPLFILGDHRSGTTLLYKILAETRCFNIVTAYHVIKYDEVLHNYVEGREGTARGELAETFAELGLTNRVIDGTLVSPDLPEEYGFVIDPGSRPKVNDKTLPGFIELCTKIQYISNSSRPLLLKNPWDTLSFVYIKKRFPESKFVFIHRHPTAVINSQMRAIRSLLESKNGYAALTARWYQELFDNPIRLFGARLLFSPTFPILERTVARHVTLICDYFSRNISLLSPRDYISLRYEDLCEDPDSAIGRTIDFLGVQHSPAGSYKRYIDARSPQLLPEAVKAFHRIRGRLQPYLALHGYDTDPMPGPL